MTVGAATIKEKNRVSPPRIGRVPRGRHVTLCAQPWVCHFEQSVVDRAVRFVTVYAALEHRRVFIQKRSASFRVAGITVVVYGGLFELGGIGRAVRVVAVRTGQFPLANRHMRRAHELRFPLQVTLPAHFRLGSFVKERRLVTDLGQLEAVAGLFHQRVAVDASYAPACMRTGFPIGLYAALMATETGFVLDFRRLPGSFRNVIIPPTPLPPPAATWLLPGP